MLINLAHLRVAGSAVPAAFDPRPFLFPRALTAFEDPSRHRVWPSGRGSAKTTTAQYALLEAATSTDGCAVIYMLDTAVRAREVAWPDLVKWNRELKLGGKVNGTRLTIVFPNGATLYVTGADRMDLFDRKRGIKKIKLLVLDEAQDWDPAVLKYAVTVVFMPRLGDLERTHGIKGRILVCGTGTSAKGYFYEIVTKPEMGFSRQSWDAWSNPWIADPDGEFVATCEGRGVPWVRLDKPIISGPDARPRWVDCDDAQIRREFFAEFNSGGSTQILQVGNQNLVDELDLDQHPSKVRYVIAADFGTIDACGVVVWAHHRDRPYFYVVETLKDTGLSASEQVKFVRSVIDRYRAKGLAGVVGDGGGLGKALMLDIQKTEHFFNVEPAEKANKVPALRLMAGDLRNGTIKIPRQEAGFIAELQEPEWHPDFVGERVKAHVPDKVDAALYGYRKIKELFIHKAPKPEPSRMEQMRQMAARRARQAQNPLG